MPTEVILTGTGYPRPDAERAGPGVLVRHGETLLQFDAGRATIMRLAGAGVTAAQLSALFITHHHSDHLLGIPDIVLTRWIVRSERRTDRPLPIVAPRGPSLRFAERVLDLWDDDIAVRRLHTGDPTTPSLDPVGFDAPDAPEVVWSHGGVRVSAVLVRHGPVVPSVAYRVDTPDGAAVISGDTIVCPEIERLSRGADVLVHEAMLHQFIEQQPNNPITNYHADTVELGALAARAAVPALVLMHLIPAPHDDAQEQAYVDEARRGGYQGRVIVGRDLARLVID